METTRITYLTSGKERNDIPKNVVSKVAVVALACLYETERAVLWAC